MSNRRWDKPRYQRITAAEVVDKDQLRITFENGDVVSLAAGQLLPPGAASPRWRELSFDPYEITVPIALGETEIPWSTVRLLSDSEFAGYWAQAAENEARQIGPKIRELRLRKNLTSKEVADRAGITPQSLSRIENGRHDVVFTTLEKLLAAMGYTLKDLANVETQPPSLKSILKKLEDVGLDRDWVMARFISPGPRGRFEQGGDAGNLLENMAESIARVFHWSTAAVLAGEPLRIDTRAVQAAKFKNLPKSQEIRARAYIVYVHYMALLTLQATSHVNKDGVIASPKRTREAILEGNKGLSLEAALRYLWGSGIPVLPLRDPGAFHGACWKISGKNIIVLKQVTKFHGRWLFDLAHEMGHVALHLSDQTAMVVETDEIQPFEQDDPSEQEANQFASELLLSGNAEKLVKKCVEVAGGRVEALKSAVIQVAAEEHVPVDILANYIAYRLDLANRLNWWGAANNLQITDPSPVDLARKIFLENIDLSKLNTIDQKLLLQAIE